MTSREFSTTISNLTPGDRINLCFDGKFHNVTVLTLRPISFLPHNDNEQSRKTIFLLELQEQEQEIELATWGHYGVTILV